MKKCSSKCLICVIEPQSYLKIKYSRNIPTWNASTWSSKWGKLIWIIALDSRGLVWPEDSGKQGDLATKSHSGNTELLKVSKIYLGFKSSPTPTDLCHMYKLDGKLHHFVKNQWHMTHDTWHETSYLWPMICHTWPEICDMWEHVNLFSKCQLPCSYGLGLNKIWRFG